MEHSRAIVFIGDVDHGKTTLISRIMLATSQVPDTALRELKRISRDLGKDMELSYLIDQLEEEQQTDATLETTQVTVVYGHRRFLLIDVPGHAALLKNMLTGASCARSAVLVIDAQKGIEEQTRTHIALAGMIGITRAVLAVNKMDTVQYRKDRFEHCVAGARALCAHAGVALSAAVPVSAREGILITQRSSLLPWYRGLPLMPLLAALTAPAAAAHQLRLPVQDIYTEDGALRIVGMIAAGTLRNNANIRILPAGIAARVIRLCVLDRPARKAHAGMNVALTLASPTAVIRGNVLVADDDRSPLITTDVRAAVVHLDAAPLRVGHSITLRLATQRVSAVVTAIIPSHSHTADPAHILSARQTATVHMTTNTPLVCDRFPLIPAMGRFILEKDGLPLSAGIILDNM